MRCKYCGNKANVAGKDICSNCYAKRKRVRELTEISERIKDLLREKEKRSGQK